MENGLTAQLMNSVTPMPRAWALTWPSAAKSIFSSIGVIITQMSSPTGRFTWATSRAPTARKKPGASWPRTMPARMHRPTHAVR